MLAYELCFDETSVTRESASRWLRQSLSREIDGGDSLIFRLLTIETFYSISMFLFCVLLAPIPVWLVQINGRRSYDVQC